MIDALGRVPVKVWVEDFEFGEDFQALTTVANVIAALPADAIPEVVAWLREQGAVDVLPTNSIEDEEFGELLPVLYVEEHGVYLVVALSSTEEAQR